MAFVFLLALKSRLNPGGAVTLFVQLYESNTEAVKERDRHVHGGLPERRGLGQHQ